MGLKHTSNHAASTDSPWGVVHAVRLTVSAICVFLATGCVDKPVYLVGLKPEAPCADRESPVDTLRPTFRWEAFPRAKDLEELGPHGGERIAAVSYEWRLWKVGDEFSGAPETPGTIDRIEVAADYKYSWRHECRDTDPGELVVTKQGLVTHEHTLETPLQPNSRFFWTVRAHFTLDGKRRATEWSEQLPNFTVSPEFGFQSQADGCSYPATFHLIRTPKE
ncbi:MAG: hypothetical protein ACREIJ_04280 [Nitrospiraceae bacterium]